MTSVEMLNLWKVGFEVLASNSAPGFDDADVYILLNRAQDLIIEQLVLQKDWLRLQTIIKENSTNVAVSPANIGQVTLPTDYKYYVKSYSQATREALPSTGFIGTKAQASAGKFLNEEVPVDIFDKFTVNSFNSTVIFEKPKVCIKTGKLNVFPDSYTTISSVVTIYIKERAEITDEINCELDKSLHRLIVEKAIDLAKKIIFIQEPQSSN